MILDIVFIMDIERLTLWTALIFMVSGYQHFQDSIPNGKNVPHPCIDGLIWEGVGHENHRGAGARNVFGQDFSNNGKVWNLALCRNDSDGDGKTNGEELGDPDCTWTPGSNPKYTTGLSHPGVCQPFDSYNCDGRPSYVNCNDDGKFKCDVISEPETFNLTVRFPKTPVPAKETTYICIVFEFPKDVEYHMVASEPVISNREVMHHTLVFGCEGATTAPGRLGEPKECEEEMSACLELIAAWGAGGGGNCLNSNMGFLIGAKKGLKYGIMQHHWNNPQKSTQYVDSSGMIFHLTPKLRPYNAGFLMIGQYSLQIPPGRPSFSSSGSCDGSCTSKVMNSSIHITSVANHMHLLGHAQHTEQRRNGTTIRTLAADPQYDYNTPVQHVYRIPVELMPGDELATTCVFSSLNKTTTTMFGEATSDEMCLSFLTYYPKENFNTTECVSYRSLSHCERLQPIVRGCDQKKILNYSDPETLAMSTSINNLCSPGFCREECLNYVKTLKTQPCFVGDIGDYLRMESLQNLSSPNLLETISFYARLDSCDKEILLEQFETKIGAGSTTLPPMMIMILATAFTVAMF